MPETTEHHEAEHSRRFLQTPFWAEFKAAHGWTALYFRVEPPGDGTAGWTAVPCGTQENPANERSSAGDARTEETNERSSGSRSKANERSFVISVMVRSFTLLRLRRVSLAYIPMAPEETCVLSAADAQALRNGGTGGPEEKDAFVQAASAYRSCLLGIAAAVRPHLPKGTMLLRFDPPVSCGTLEAREELSAALPGTLKGKGKLKKSASDIQPPDTSVLSLAPTEEELLSGMRSKWRYNVRLSAKKGVTVSRHYGTDADFRTAFEEFHGLFMQTSERDGVSFHSKDYYADLLRRGAPVQQDKGRPLVTLYLARHEGEALAGIITLFCRREAVYLYGASGNSRRNLMPAYLLQWTAIQDAKKAGCPEYDFYGMPPTDDERHPMHGLYLFKTGFGGKTVHRPGSFDVPLSWGSGLYSLAERLRAWYHKKLLKKLKGR